MRRKRRRIINEKEEKAGMMVEAKMPAEKERRTLDPLDLVEMQKSEVEAAAVWRLERRLSGLRV